MITCDYNNEFALPILSNFRCIFPKEEKKVKVMSQKKFRKLDYLSVKIVKVEKKKDKYFAKGKIQGRIVGLFKKDSEICSETIKPNSENVDKIKFPAPCSYISHTGKKRYALLLKGKDNNGYKYELLKMSQDNGESIFLSNTSLKHLIRKWNIHILKGRIVLFEEE